MALLKDLILDLNKTFNNNELVALTKEGQETGCHICWYLVDGVLDTDATRLETYNLIKEAFPYRVHIGQLSKPKEVSAGVYPRG